MNMMFVICAVAGLTILGCQLILSVLGFGERAEFLDHDTDHEANTEHDNESESIISRIDLDTETRRVDHANPSRKTLTRLRAIGLAITFFGMMGIAAEAAQFSVVHIFLLATLAAAVAYLSAVFILRQGAILPFDDSIPAIDETDHEGMQWFDNRSTNETSDASREIKA